MTRRTTSLLVAATALLALVALLAGGVVLVARSRPPGRPVDSPFPPTAPAAPLHPGWASGSVIHGGAGTVDVGRVVNRYVETSVGYVFSDDRGRVWSAVNGAVTRVGDTGGPLVGNPGSELAAWADGSQRTLVFRILDQTTGRVVSSRSDSSSAAVAPGEYVDGAVIAVDGDTVYFRDKAGLNEATLTPSSTTVGPVGTGTRVDVPRSAGNSTVSPTGRWVADGSTEGRGRAQVTDAHTGDTETLAPTAWSALPYQWLDDDTVAVLVVPTPSSDYQLQTCSAFTRRCTVAVAHLAPGPARRGSNGADFRLPTGDYYFPYPHG